MTPKQWNEREQHKFLDTTGKHNSSARVQKLAEPLESPKGLRSHLVQQVVPEYHR